jgi:hypothetical protein
VPLKTHLKDFSLPFITMTHDGWECVSDEKVPELPFDSKPMVMTGPPPPDYDIEMKSNGRPRLIILGATWGGVVVTDDIQAMTTTEELININMSHVRMFLEPDPAHGVKKTLSIMYRYDGPEKVGPYLLNLIEGEKSISIDPSIRAASSKASCAVRMELNPWRADKASVEILGVLYGPKRIENPAVYEQLTEYFEGRRGQIRMTCAFFKTDPWYGYRKSWSVYFRFVGSDRVQVVTGMEGGALEVPWGRH